ncbi:peptidase domain-containing ABC transporter [Archangium gephyra]|uniref:peptidase domain-containing ABC transporter n=1 Tax=Archangium gephyra TaxID=48 RepID=UPI003B7C334A
MGTEDQAPLGERFPALRRLWKMTRARRIPDVRQMTLMDCGAACLSMVLGYHGRHMTLEEVRAVTGVSRDGTSARALLEAARRLGMRGRGISIDLDRLAFLQPATILHWRFTHYVVFERLGKGYVDIRDPMHGRRRVSMEQFSQCFTGIALELEPADDFQPGRSPRKGWGRYLAPLLKQSRTLGRIFTLSIMLQLFAVALPLLMSMVVDRVIPRGDQHLLMVLGVGMMSIVVFQFLASLIRGFLLTEVRVRMDSELTLGFLDHMVSLSFPFFQLRPAGDLMQRVSTNSTLREMLSSGMISTLIDGVLVLIYLSALLVINGWMGLLVLGLGTMQILVLLLSGRRQRQLMSQNLELEGKNYTYLMDMISGIQTLKAFGVEGRAVQNYANVFVDVLNVAVARGLLGVWVEALTSMLRLASPLLLLMVGTWQVLQGQLSTGEMLGLNALAASVLVPLSNLVVTGAQLQMMGSYMERLSDVLDMPKEPLRGQEDGPGALSHRGL